MSHPCENNLKLHFSTLDVFCWDTALVTRTLTAFSTQLTLEQSILVWKQRNFVLLKTSMSIFETLFHISPSLVSLVVANNKHSWLTLL